MEDRSFRLGDRGRYHALIMNTNPYSPTSELDSPKTVVASQSKVRWRIALYALITLVLLVGFLMPAFQEVRESGPHPTRHPYASPAEPEEVVPALDQLPEDNRD